MLIVRNRKIFNIYKDKKTYYLDAGENYYKSVAESAFKHSFGYNEGSTLVK